MSRSRKGAFNMHKKFQLSSYVGARVKLIHCTTNVNIDMLHTSSDIGSVLSSLVCWVQSME